MTSTSKTNSMPAGKPTNAYGKQRVKLTFTSNYKNLRSRPSGSSVDEGDLLPGDEVDMFSPDIPDEQGVTDQGQVRVWRWIENIPRNQGAGYLCMTGIKAVPVEVPLPAPTPEPEPPTSTVSLDSTVVDTAPAVIIPPTEQDSADQTVTQFIVNVTRVKSTGALAITVTSENSAAVERILATAIALTQIARPLIKQLVKYEAIIDSLTFSISDSKTNKS